MEDGKRMEIINESSLSRIWSNNEKYECAAMSAWRRARDCGKGEPYTHKENQKRNKSLKAKLMSAGYGVTAVLGKYPEGGKEAIEDSYFIVNLNRDESFFRDIAKISESFEQDSVLLVPEGAISNTGEKAYLYGTNRCANNWLGYHKKSLFEKGKLGYTSPIYTTYVNNRPFVFEEGFILKECTPPCSGMGIWMMGIVANADWETLEI